MLSVASWANQIIEFFLLTNHYKPNKVNGNIALNNSLPIHCTANKHLSTYLHEIVEKSVLAHSQANIKTQLPCLVGVEKETEFLCPSSGIDTHHPD